MTVSRSSRRPTDPADLPTNIRLSQGGHPKKSVAHTFGRHGGTQAALRNLPRRAELGEVDVIDLAIVRELHTAVDEAIAATVAVLLAQGVSYGEVGRALGVSRQAARQTYGAKAVTA
jgi:hypothetical protein